MTVTGLERAKALVEEIGKDKVKAVYRYNTIEGKGEQYAVFLKGDYIDIHGNPYVVDPRLVFIAGAWSKTFVERHFFSVLFNKEGEV